MPNLVGRSQDEAEKILYRVPTKIEFEVNGTEKALPETEQRAGDE